MGLRACGGGRELRRETLLFPSEIPYPTRYQRSGATRRPLRRASPKNSQDLCRASCPADSLQPDRSINGRHTGTDVGRSTRCRCRWDDVCSGGVGEKHSRISPPSEETQRKGQLGRPLNLNQFVQFRAHLPIAYLTCSSSACCFSPLPVYPVCAFSSFSTPPFEGHISLHHP